MQRRSSFDSAGRIGRRDETVAQPTNRQYDGSVSVPAMVTTTRHAPQIVYAVKMR